MDIQPYLYGKETGIGKCSFSNAEIARRLGISIPSVKKYNSYLIEHGYLSEETTDEYDEAGLPVIQKSFNLNGLKQAALWVKAVTEQIIMNTEDIETLKTSNAELYSEINQLKRELELMKKEKSLEKNRVITNLEYTM